MCIVFCCLQCYYGRMLVLHLLSSRTPYKYVFALYVYIVLFYFLWDCTVLCNWLMQLLTLHLKKKLSWVELLLLLLYTSGIIFWHLISSKSNISEYRHQQIIKAFSPTHRFLTNYLYFRKSKISFKKIISEFIGGHTELWVC